MKQSEEQTGMDGLGGAVVLLSGGMDSVTLLHHVVTALRVPAVFPLSVHYGQRHARELEMACRQVEALGLPPHQTLDLSGFDGLVGQASSLTQTGAAVPDLADLDARTLDQPPTYVPNRNMVLLSLAAAYAESCGVDAVYYGAQAQDEYGYWDCTEEFVCRMNETLALNRRVPVRIHVPFVQWRKAQVLETGLRLGVNYANTWTCYRGGAVPCMRCPSCVERERAFATCGVQDPLLQENR